MPLGSFADRSQGSGFAQFDDPVLNATEAFFPLRFVRKRLLPDALEECIVYSPDWARFFDRHLDH